jgi:hypothetical protein
MLAGHSELLELLETKIRLFPLLSDDFVGRGLFVIYGFMIKNEKDYILTIEQSISDLFIKEEGKESPTFIIFL